MIDLRGQHSETGALAVVDCIGFAQATIGVDDDGDGDGFVATKTVGVPLGCGLRRAAGCDIADKATADIPIAPTCGVGKEGGGDGTAVATADIAKAGIDIKRIISKGYGESKLLNNCKDNQPCSEIEHAQNRRIEFKILGADWRGHSRSVP